MTLHSDFSHNVSKMETNQVFPEANGQRDREGHGGGTAEAQSYRPRELAALSSQPGKRTKPPEDDMLRVLVYIAVPKGDQ